MGGEKYDVVQHVLDDSHSINDSNSLKLTRTLWNDRYSDAYKTIIISKFNKLMNSNKHLVHYIVCTNYIVKPWC